MCRKLHGGGDSNGIYKKFRTHGYRIVDINMCVLQSSELYVARFFSKWGINDQDYRGVKHSKDKQDAQRQSYTATIRLSSCTGIIAGVLSAEISSALIKIG